MHAIGHRKRRDRKPMTLSKTNMDSEHHWLVEEDNLPAIVGVYVSFRECLWRGFSWIVRISEVFVSVAFCLLELAQRTQRTCAGKWASNEMRHEIAFHMGDVLHHGFQSLRCSICSQCLQHPKQGIMLAAEQLAIFIMFDHGLSTCRTLLTTWRLGH